MAEKNILAFFKTMEAAEGAKAKLQALRAADISIDRIGRFPGGGVDHAMNPIAGDVPGIGYLTQDADFADKSAAILAAADVTASGMSDGGQDAVTGRDILLTVVIDERNYDQALRIVREAGGLV